MNRALAALVVASAAVTACTADAEGPADRSADIFGDTPAGTGAAACAPDVDAAFAAWADAGFDGTVAVTTAGEPECLGAYGTADEAIGTAHTVDTVFSIGSVSKAFTAAAVVALAEDGAFALDDRAGDLLADLDGPVADATVEQLLLHESGLTGDHGRDHEPLGRDEAVAVIGDLELAFAPGADVLYSNAGYTLLALIIEETSGSTYRDWMAAHVLRLPDGGAAGGFWDGEPAAPGPRAVGRLDDGPSGERGDAPGPHWALDGNGDLAMTAEDLAAWTHALFTGRIVSPEAAEILGRPGADTDGDADADAAAETPGWVAQDATLLGEPLLVASGGGGDIGHEAVVAWLPRSERVLVIMSSSPEVPAQDLLVAVGPALAAGDPLPLPEGPAAGGEIEPTEAAAVVGTYELAAGGTVAVEVDERQLTITPRGSAAFAAVFPPPEGVTLDAVAEHERAVTALLAGETAAGRDELETLESDLGAVERTEVLGTAFQDGELRTFVEITTSDDLVTLWYALDERGGIAAVDAAGSLPARGLVPGGDGEGYRAGGGSDPVPQVSVMFADDTVTITGPARSTAAERSG